VHEHLEDIADDDVLYRWISPEYIKRNGAVSSGAYKRWSRDEGKFVPDAQISVDLARLTSAKEMQARSSRPGTRIGALVAAVPRGMGLTVRHAPDVECGNRAHCVIEGPNDAVTCRRLAEQTTLTL
jgi:hypothetical protein